MSSETALAYSWVYTTASADSQLMAAATGGIWQGLADIGVVAPYLSFTRQAGVDILTMNAVRLFAEILLQIKAVGPASSFLAIVTIANRIDALFKDTRNVSISGGAVLNSHREQELAQEELVNGQQWNHLGGLYRLQLQGN